MSQVQRSTSAETRDSRFAPIKLTSEISQRSRACAVSDRVLDVLIENGVDTVFGIPGGAISCMYGALLERPEIRVVNAKHETGAVFLAMGYSMATGRPSCVITTAGPGITNALTGLASAFYDNVPVIMLSGEVPTSAFGRGALQEGSQFGLDVVSQVRRITKFAAQVTRPETAAAVMRKAIFSALSGRRGPVFVSLPLNVSAADLRDSGSISGGMITSFQIDGAGCRRAAELLLNAKRPFILAGAGARGAENRAAVRRLVERTGAPLAVSPKAKGVFPEDHPLYLGLFGFGGHESVVRYLEGGVDVMLVCGSGLNDFATNSWSPLLSASEAFIQIDIDAAQLGKNYPIDLGLLGPIDAVVDRMMREVEGHGPARPRDPVGGLTVEPLRSSSKGMLTTAEAVLLLNERCRPDSVFTADMGEHLSMALHYLRVPERGDFLTCLGFGSMGSGIGSAIGYQIAVPDQRVYSICGDGCFLMYGSELATAVQHRARVTFLIANDSELNMCRFGLKDLFGRSPDVSTPEIDFATIARSMGAEGRVVRTLDELSAALDEEVDGPLVIDMRVDPDVRLEGSQRTAALRQFQAG